MEDVQEHVIYKLLNAKVNLWPYPHFYVENVFPDFAYKQLLQNLPKDEEYKPLGGFKRRDTAPSRDIVADLDTQRFLKSVLISFGSEVFFGRYPNHDRPEFESEFRVIRDGKGYFIGPHTDAPRKVVSLLFYLPRDTSYEEFGTGIYTPNDPDKKCKGGPHYKFNDFKEVWRAPFSPNSVFGFFKTDDSWHGVQEITKDFKRDVLLYNVYEKWSK